MIELDEAWSFVWRRRDKRWPEQRCTTGPQVVAFVCGGRGGDACRAGAGAAGLPQVRQLQRLLEGPTWRCSRRRLTAVSAKETGETAHMERWYKTLCQCIARFVREALSFFKKNWWHETGWTHWFIVEYNLSCSE